MMENPNLYEDTHGDGCGCPADQTLSIDGTPGWAYDEDDYCVCCGNGRWKHHMPDCELRDALDRPADLANGERVEPGASPRQKRTGECPECGGTFSVRKNGTLRVHGYGVHIYYATGPECPGSGQLPMPDPPKEEGS